MDSKPTVRILAACAAVILLMGACAAGFLAGRISIPEAQALPEATTEQSATDLLFTPFWEAWQIVHDQYLEQPVDDQALLQGAIRGMMEALGDEHSAYMDPVQFEDANAPLEGYTGIGAWVNTDGDYLTVIEPIPGSPAEAAGLQAGDQVIAIDGEDMTGIDPELARRRVLGPEGTQVILTILREGSEAPFDVSIMRALIIIPSVDYEMLEGNIAYVQLFTFGAQSTEELHAALQELMAQNPRGLIFDLRNNSGGYLDSAIVVASEFLAEGVVTFEEYGDGTREIFEVTGDGVATEIPMIVLVNEWSASASELVAGALQDHGRAQLVGVVTFGKGTVQNWIALSNEQGAIRVTVARWLTPNERSIHQTGLTPDILVEISEEDIAAGRDPQLETAIELLSSP